MLGLVRIIRYKKVCKNAAASAGLRYGMLHMSLIQDTKHLLSLVIRTQTLYIQNCLFININQLDALNL